MCAAKSKGEMGFRDLYGFNVALLEKHTWNFMYSPDSLVSKLFKSRYFPNDHILQAKKGSGSSFIWSGIWSAKEELRKSFR